MQQQREGAFGQTIRRRQRAGGRHRRRVEGRRVFVQLPHRVEAAEAVAVDVLGAGDIVLARRLDAGHPAPGQGVGCRIRIHQVMQEQIRAQRPGQAQREDPDARHPHPHMVVQPARLPQLRHPGVEAGDAGRTAHRAFIGPAQPAIRREHRAVPRQFRAIGVPQRGAEFEKPLPVAAPEHLLDEFLRRLGAVMGQRGADQLGLRHQPVPHGGRQQGHIAPRAGAGIAVAPGGIGRPHARREGGQPREGGGAGGREGFGRHAGRRSCRAARPQPGLSPQPIIRS